LDYTGSATLVEMHLHLQLKAIACHLTALLWIPTGILLAIVVGQSRLGQIMFLGSLSMAADWEHSANFALMAWLVFIVLVAMVLILWIPLAIALTSLRLENPLDSFQDGKTDRLIIRSSLNVCNWLLSCILLLATSTIIVEWLDRLIAPPDSPPWITWSLAALVLSLAITQIILAIRACLGVMQGKSKRYFFAIPLLH
jgi:hypothetical protein